MFKFCMHVWWRWNNSLRCTLRSRSKNFKIQICETETDFLVSKVQVDFLRFKLFLSVPQQYVHNVVHTTATSKYNWKQFFSELSSISCKMIFVSYWSDFLQLIWIKSATFLLLRVSSATSNSTKLWSWRFEGLSIK